MPINSGFARFEPWPWIHGLAGFADLEIQLRACSPATVARRGDRIAGGYLFADGFEEPLVVSVETHVAITVVDDRQQPESG